MAVLSLNSNIFFRTPGGHGDDIRQADRLIQATAPARRRGALHQPNAESFGAAYPYGLGKLDNIQLAQRPIPSADAGRDQRVARRSLRSRLAHACRLWIVEIDASAPAGDCSTGCTTT